jgi:DNA end-binding protein Ku
MASSAWKGFISFGLVSIPIRLYAAARSSTIRLHQVHNVCKTRLKQPLFCPTCNRIVERSEVVKGYEDDDGKYRTRIGAQHGNPQLRGKDADRSAVF